MGITAGAIEPIKGKPGKITDIFGYLKKAVETNPDLAKDSKTLQAIKANNKQEIEAAKRLQSDYEANVGKKIVDDFKAAEGDRIGTKRAELEDVLEKHGIGLADAYEKLTDKQKAYGKITSKLSFAAGIDEVEKIFTWAEIEFGPLSWKERCLSLFQAAELIGTTPANYRGIRKIFLALTEGNTLEVKPEDLIAPDKVQTVQKTTGAKLLKAKDFADVEACFDWAEVELQKQLVTLDKYIVFFQIVEMLDLGEKHYKAIRKIFVRMNKD